VQNEVLLYDVTSTYFEGQALGNPQAQRGHRSLPKISSGLAQIQR